MHQHKLDWLEKPNGNWSVETPSGTMMTLYSPEDDYGYRDRSLWTWCACGHDKIVRFGDNTLPLDEMKQYIESRTAFPDDSK